jgi:hypothetical protein
MKNSSKPICGAKNRQGLPCEKPPLKGKTRCKLHGGKTPVKQNAGSSNGNHKHSLYANALTETEAAAWDTVPVGNVDDDIRMCRIWLARAMELDSAINRDPHSMNNKAGLVLSEVRQSSCGDNKSTDVITRRPDTIARINMLLGRIAQLEKTRAELLTAARESGEGIDDKARDLVETLREMKALELEQPERDRDDE